MCEYDADGDRYVNDVVIQFFYRSRYLKRFCRLLVVQGLVKKARQWLHVRLALFVTETAMPSKAATHPCHFIDATA